MKEIEQLQQQNANLSFSPQNPMPKNKYDLMMYEAFSDHHQAIEGRGRGHQVLYPIMATSQKKTIHHNVHNLAFIPQVIVADDKNR